MAKTTLFKGIVYLSQEQYNRLIALGAIEVNGNVIEYDESILYVTPQTLPEDYYTKEQTKDLIKNQIISGDEFIIVDEGKPGSATEGKTVIELDRTNIETETATENSEKLITSGAVFKVFNALANADVQIDNSSITKNDSGQIQTTGVIDQNTLKVNKEWTGTQAQYNALAEKDPDTLYYITDGKSLPTIEDLTLTIANSVISSAEKFTHHVHVMIEFETDGVHGGTDFILHPFDTSICFVTYDILVNGQLYSSQAYLDEAGNIKINVPAGLTFTNTKGHYIEYGG